MGERAYNNPRPGEAEFKPTLVYRVSCRTARERNTISKTYPLFLLLLVMRHKDQSGFLLQGSCTRLAFILFETRLHVAQAGLELAM